jgi:hypothetical protein
MKTSGMLREELTLDTKVGKVESTITHQGHYFWVVNKFPWYAAGIHQCVCTEAREGGDHSKPGVYPIQYNWTQQVFFVAREKIGIEYSNGRTEVLDHWAFGPHHVWSDPKTGTLYRAWQPFNGLQIFPEGTNPGPVPTDKFKDSPPALCKKGGAAFRVKCTDDGYPQNATQIRESQSKLKGRLLSLSASPLLARESDQKRAIERVPRAEYRGDTFRNMSDALNKWLIGSAPVKTCDRWDSASLQELLGLLYLARNSDLDQIYQGVSDNRRLRGTLNDMQAKWRKLNSLIATHPKHEELHRMQRDGHCHQAVMWYVHHLNEDVKKLLGESGVEIPLLSYNNHLPACATEARTDPVRKQVCEHYQETVTCFSCHSNVRPSVV